MWFTFALAVIASAVVLYVPGYFAARALKISRFSAVVVAPAFSLFFLVLLGIILQKAAVSCPAIALFAAATAIGVVAYIASALISKATGAAACTELAEDASSAHDPESVRRLTKTAALYIGVALIMTVAVFLLSIDGPDSFSRNDDTTVHLAVVRGFLDTGTYSTLASGSFIDQGSAGSFYPSAWHVATAIVASLFDNNVALGTNAMIVAVLVLVLPLGMCALISRVFGTNRRFVLAGSVVVLAFTGFPWGFVVFGQLLPNMLAFSLIPLALVLLMGAVDAARCSERVRLIAAVVLALIAIAFSQPNGAFTFGIWAVLYGISRVFYRPGETAARISGKSVALALGIFAVACAAWAYAYTAPFMQGVVQYTRPATLSTPESIVSGLMFMFTVRQGVQPFLSILVLVGIIYTCRNRRYLWMTVAYFAALIMYIVSVSTDGVFKHVLTGFWYTDYNRTGAMAAFYAIPLAAIGFACTLSWLQKMIERVTARKTSGTVASSTPAGSTANGSHAASSADAQADETRLVACSSEQATRGKASSGASDKGVHRTALIGATCVLLSAFLVCEFAPVHVKFSEKRDIYMGVAQIKQELFDRYSWGRSLTGEEDAFIDEVMATIPDGALVINTPHDGSCWSYGVEGINTFYRRRSNTGGNPNAEAAGILRTELCNVASSEEVQQTLEDLDAHYLMMLDTPRDENSTVVNLRYEKENWQGIESINENTPGFKLLLSKGDMRLYEIVG